MKIVYTVNGEGMGHAIRSSVVIEYLRKEGYEIKIFTAGKQPVEYLRKRFKDVTAVTGTHMVYVNNKVRRLQTAAKVLREAKGIRKDLQQIKKELKGFKPDVVITDFEFHGEIISRLYKVPLVSIDNIQYITQAKFSIAAEDMIDYELNYIVARMLVPRADHFFITTFDEPKVRKNRRSSRVSFVSPLLRDKIVKAKPTNGNHILVYQTSNSYTQLFKVLNQINEQFVVYNAPNPNPGDNVICKKFSEDGFIADLASAKAVIVNGGFTVISESLFLKKPILSVPIKNFYEQRLNGLLLEKMGYGMTVKRLSKSSVQNFVSNIDLYKKALSSLSFDSADFFRQLDEVLQKVTR